MNKASKSRSGKHWDRIKTLKDNYAIRIDQKDWSFAYNDIKNPTHWTGSRGKKLVISKKGDYTIRLNGNQIKTLKKLLAEID